MPKALVVVDTYRWTETDDKGNRTAVREASRGDVIDVPDAEFERGRSLNALMDPGERLSTLQRVAALEAEAAEAEASAREKRTEAIRARAAVYAIGGDEGGPGVGFALADAATAQGRVLSQDELIAYSQGINDPAGQPAQEGLDLRTETKASSRRSAATAESGGEK